MKKRQITIHILTFKSKVNSLKLIYKKSLQETLYNPNKELQIKTA